MTNSDNDTTPLASKMRPQNLDEFVGQGHLVGKGKPIRKLIKADELVSMIFWGPPGCGKTTLARIIANETRSRFVQLSAVQSGKDDMRKVISLAKGETGQQNDLFSNVVNEKTPNRVILFVDEIHRFNKAQQDYLLPFVEDGTITLIGATTENPSFEVISPLLSRCRVFVLKRHKPDAIKQIIKRAIEDKVNGLGKVDVEIKKDALEFLANASNGDPRTALNALELSVKLARGK